jgi:hypothetical protein
MGRVCCSRGGCLEIREQRSVVGTHQWGVSQGSIICTALLVAVVPCLAGFVMSTWLQDWWTFEIIVILSGLLPRPEMTMSMMGG